MTGDDMEKKSKFPFCGDARKCFARKKGRCLILETTYQSGLCPFCKPYRQFTKGQFYPDKAVSK